jgi:hypothetical protein
MIDPTGFNEPVPWIEEKVESILDQDRVRQFMDAGRDHEDAPVARCRRVVLDGYLDGVVDGYVRQCCHDEDVPGVAKAEQEIGYDGCYPKWEADEPCIGYIGR